MRTHALPLGLLCVALTLSPAVAGLGSPAASVDTAQTGSAPIRIMLGGDSITQGFDGDYTWRYRLYKEFQRQHEAVNFVGPSKYPYGGANHYAINSGWDMDHDATGGTRLRTQLHQITSDMAARTARPDVLVELYGTTDLLPRAASDPQKTVPLNEEIADLRSYIQDVRDVNANVDIVLGEITTRRIPNRQAFNDALAKLAAEKNADPTYTDSRVVVADLDYSGWNPATDTYDRVHPTPAGEAKIAQRVALALKKLGVLPQVPKISSAGLHYAPPWAPKFRVTRSHRIVIDWSETKWLNKPQLLRARIKNLRTGHVGISAWISATKYTSSILRPGYYQVSMMGRRQSMISPWSKIWTVHVTR
jgi:lysophospholipase L1-like esterase